MNIDRILVHNKVCQVMPIIIIVAVYLNDSQPVLAVLIVLGIASLGEHFLLYSSNIESNWAGKVDLMFKIACLLYVLYKFSD